MATERKRWFYVADAVGRAGWTNDELATFVRLISWLNTRRSREGLTPEESCSAFIPMGDILTITGAGKVSTAVPRLSRCGLHTDSLSVTRGTRDGTRRGTAGVFVEWPNLAEFQGWHPRVTGKRRAKPGEVPGHSDSGLRAPSTEHREEGKRAREALPPPTAAKAPGAASKKPPKIPFPDEGSPEFETLHQELLAWGKAARNGRSSFNPVQVGFALDRCREWGGGKHPTRTLAGWRQCLQNHLRDGWFLEGFDPRRAEFQAATDRQRVIQAEAEAEELRNPKPKRPALAAVPSGRPEVTYL